MVLRIPSLEYHHCLIARLTFMQLCALLNFQNNTTHTQTPNHPDQQPDIPATKLLL